MLRLRKAKDAPNSNEGITDPAVIRLSNELKSLDLPPQCSIEHPDPQNIRFITLTIKPDTGYWRDGVFRFQLEVPLTYPHEPPKVRCLETIWHPNINLKGRVCLNILNVGWNPVLTLYAVIIGLLHLFFDPETDDPLNKEAAEQLRQSPQVFAEIVRQTMRGRAPSCASSLPVTFSNVFR